MLDKKSVVMQLEGLKDQMMELRPEIHQYAGTKEVERAFKIVNEISKMINWIK